MIKRIIESKIFRLRPIVKSDAVSLAKYAHDRSVSRHTFIPYPYTEKNALEFINRSKIINRNLTGLNLGIEYKATGEIIGGIGFNTINHNFKRAELGYWISKKYRNEGIMSEAVTLTVKYAFSKLKLKRVHAFVEPSNKASIKVLEKCGFENEGLLKKFIKQNNRYKDMCIFAIINDK